MREVVELHWLGYCMEAIFVAVWVHTFIRIRRLGGTKDKVEKRHLRILRTVKKGDSFLLLISFVTLSLAGHIVGALLTVSVGANLGVIWGPFFANRESYRSQIPAKTPPPK